VNGHELREARVRKGWTQEQTAERLGVTQAYLSMVERGKRVLTYRLAWKAAGTLDAPPTTLPLREEVPWRQVSSGVGGSERVRAELAALGYPGFAHLRRKARVNPAEVLHNALNEADLDSRVVEGLPWLALRYSELEWDWLVQSAKLTDQQNRLGFVTTLAKQLAEGLSDEPRARKLKEWAAVLDRSRLVREDTLCHDSLTGAERKWLRLNRSAEAEHWNLLTDMKAENLPYATL